MSFLTKKKQGTATGNDPFLDAKQVWSDRLGDGVAAATQWRFVSVLALLVCAGSVAGNFYQMNQTKIIPYIIELDQVGTAKAVQPLQTRAEVPQRLIQSEIVNGITNWRTVTADLELQKRLISKLSAYIGGSAHGTIQEWFKENNPYKRAETMLVSVDVTGVPLPVSSDSWRISWRETTRSHQGVTLDVTRYEATVSVIIVPPKDEAQIIANPGGVLITSLNFGKLLN